MEQQDFEKLLKSIIQVLTTATVVVVLLLGFVVLISVNPGLLSPEPVAAVVEVESNEPEVVDGIHVRTGLLDGEGLQLVIQNCTPCHSAKLISQNRMSLESWETTIRWMQQTQNLWDLGENETPILKYLATNYAPVKKGRRAPLTDIEWYALD